MGKLFEKIDERFDLRAPHKNFLRRNIPEKLSYLSCFGGVAFTLLLVLVFTGMLMSFYYIPSETEAFRSVLTITREVKFGSGIRGMHRWSANLLIPMLLAHTLRVFLQKAYRPPRELNWIAGSLTLLLALSSGFTGYLLPWNQKAYWATVVGTNMAATVPVLGNNFLYLVRGGPDVTGATLVRFYSLHVIWLPAAMALVLWVHFHMIKRKGVTGGL